MSDNKPIGEHVKKLMKYSKRDLAIMYANLSWCFNEMTKGIKIKEVKRKR